MWLKTLKIKNIRPYKYGLVHTSPQLNIFFGSNGIGKTSLLEAIHLLATLKSFRTHHTSEIFHNDSTDLEITGHFLEPDTELTLSIIGKKKKYLKNQAPVPFHNFLEQLKVVTLAPEHQSLVLGSMDERRKFLDRILFSLDPNYLRTLQLYNRALKQNQSLLKQEIPFPMYQEWVAPWNEELATWGEEIRVKRAELLTDLEPYTQQKQLTIAPKSAALKLFYDYSPETTAAAEYRAKRALVGPHRDRVELFYRGKPMEEVGSQGEKSTLLLALKLSELELVESRAGVAPILLLDDLGATLDSERQKELLTTLSTKENQVLVTTADRNILKLAERVGGEAILKKVEELEGGFYLSHWGEA